MNTEETISAISAGSTLFAGLVALSVPFVLDWRQRSRNLAERNRKREIAYREVCFAVEKALVAFVRLRHSIDDHLHHGPFPDATYRTHLREAEGAALVLDHLLRRHDMNDDLLRCGLEAQLLANETRDTAQLVLDELERHEWVGGQGAIHASDQRAHDTLSRVQAVRARHGLQRSRKHPELPHRI